MSGKTGPSKASKVKLSEDRQKALDWHNKVRKEAPGGFRKPLVWDTALEADAIKYAKVLGTLGKMTHDTASVNKYYCGENLGEVPHHPTHNGKYRVEEFPMLRSTKYWCDEKEFYDGRVLKKDNMGISGQRGQTGHYTQIVWPEVTRVGLGKFVVAVGEKSSKYPMKNVTWVVARYDYAQKLGHSAWRGVSTDVVDFYKAMKRIQAPDTNDYLSRDARKNDEKNALALHNKVRKAAKGASRPALYWSFTLAERARKWGEYLARTGTLELDNTTAQTREGQLMWQVDKYDVRDVLVLAIETWLEQERKYRGQILDPGICQIAGSYCQIIWPEVTKVGMWAFRVKKASSGSAGAGTFVVAYYDAGLLLGKSAWR